MHKKKIKIISLLLSFIIIISLIAFKNINIKADISDKPDFDVKIDSVTPNPALLGEDITISGTITPKPFEAPVSPKEIVMVLDVSGSMSDTVIIDEKCTEKRNWRDYCSIHGEYGEHNKTSTRIDELKKAVGNFIDKMKNEKNLKIGIVAYSSIADFNPIEKLGNKRISAYGFGSHNVSNFKSHSSTFLNANDNKLYDIIDALNPLGGTNIGEGMRKAIYMLENGNPSANKTIVLMTDGEPTFYSVENRYLEEYMAIDNKTPEIAGQGSGLDSKALDYASDIGKTIKAKGYNAFSIGYGMTERGNEALEKIHSSMIGEEWNDNIELTEEDGFFKTSNGAIDSVFQQIATEIINSYPINKVDLNMDFNEVFSLNIGGNTVNIGTINYKKASEIQANDKIRYEADPVPFEFTIKGSKEGIYLVFNSLNLSYKWENEIERKTIDENVEVTINPNELPNISATLLSAKDILANPNEEITLEYQVNAANFKFENSTHVIANDVVIVIDRSGKKNNKEDKKRLDKIKEAVSENIFENTTLNNDTRYSLITFDNKESKILEYLTKDTDKLKSSLNNITVSDSSKNSGSIDESFDNIKEVLGQWEEGGPSKNIIFIAPNNSSYANGKLPSAKSIDGYNFLTLAIENKSNNKLKELHAELNERSKSKLFSYGTYFDIDENLFNISVVINEALNKLENAEIKKPYEFNLVINLNLAGNFDPVSGIQRFENNIASIEVPKVIYNYNSETGLYEANSGESNLRVSFTIKARSGRIGELGFGNAEDNKLVYEKLVYNNENDKYKYSIINTPKIEVKPQVKNLTHGLYNGIEDNNLKIDTSMAESGFNFAANSTITYGASFILTGNEVDFKLSLDEKFRAIDAGEIKAYIVDSGKLIGEGVRVENTSETNLFKLRINDSKDSSAERQVLLVYKRQMFEVEGESKEFLNSIDISGVPTKVVKVKLYEPGTNKPKLPDLF